MKKFFLLLTSVIVLATSLWFHAGIAKAQGATVTFYAPGVTEHDLKQATMFAGSEFHDVYCVLADAETDKVTCHVSGKYAEQEIRIYVAGQVFFLTVPSLNTKSEEDKSGPSETPLNCPTGQLAGADVTFFTSDATLVTLFVPGSTLTKVENKAESYLNSYYLSIEKIGDLYCNSAV